MIKLIIFCILSGLAIWLGLGMHDDIGFVIIALPHYSIELPIWLAVIGAMSAYLGFHVLMKFIHYLISIPRKIAVFENIRQRKKSVQLTRQGLIELSSHRWVEAEKYFINGLKKSELPELNYFCAAEAAHSLGSHQRRNFYLEQAKETLVNEDIIEFKRAAYEMAHGQLELASQRLTNLNLKHPTHVGVLTLLNEVYLLQNNWSALHLLLPNFKKHYKLMGVDYSYLEGQVLQGLLQDKMNCGLPDELQNVWHQLPKKYKASPTFINIYIKGLIFHHQDEMAIKILSDSIKQHWREDWILWFGQIQHPQPEKALSYAEKWVKTHSKSANLFLTLGRLAEKSQIWGLAERYLETSLTLLPTYQGYAALGLLYEQLGKEKESQLCYKKGLLLVSEKHDISGLNSMKLQKDPHFVVPSLLKFE